MIVLYKPTLKDLTFRRQLLADEETMAYNHAYGGTIAFPEERWEGWYDRWVGAPDRRFYRFLRNEDTGEFVGEVAYHYEEAREIVLCDVIMLAAYRGRGYGTAGLALLCEAARTDGIPALYDEIAVDNPSIKLFLKNGFSVEFETDEFVMVRKILQGGGQDKKSLDKRGKRIYTPFVS